MNKSSFSRVQKNQGEFFGKFFRWLMSAGGVGFAMVLLMIVFGLVNPKFISSANITNILVQISINIVIATGMMMVILLGGIDLSVGSVLALCSVLAGKVLTAQGIPVGVAIFLCCIVSFLVGIACGLFNGFVSEKWKIHPFIVTLGMMNIARGAALKITGANTIYNFPTEFSSAGELNILGMPAIFLISLSVILIGLFVLTKTVYGRFLYSIGNNEEAVRLSGHNVRIKKILAFMICGGCAGIAAVLYMLRLNISSPIIGYNFELNAIAAVIIGGTSMFGGKGSLIGTFFGACIIGILNNGLLLAGVDDFVRQMITGGIIVGAVILDKYRNKLSNALITNAEQLI